MQNPFTTTFSKTPEFTYIDTEKTYEILENFNYERPSESVYKITGVRGSGKTVLLAKIEEHMRSEEQKNSGWLVFDINPSRNMLKQFGAMLIDEGFGKKNVKNKHISVSANVLGTGGGFEFSKEDSEQFSDIGVEIEKMLQEVQKRGKRILIGIDEVSKTPDMIEFASEFGKWLRAAYPVYLVCTGLYENIMNVCNVNNLTFFRRATTVITQPLNAIKMSEMYRKYLDVSIERAREMSKLTKGYAYAFQQLGVLYFKKRESESLDDIVFSLKSELYSYSYEKIWEELSESDRALVRLLTDKNEYKREEVLILMGDKSVNYSMYRDRLIKRGILSSRQGFISLALPFFAEYVKEYCL